MQDIIEFESKKKKFNRSLTLRVSFRKRVTKEDLKLMFDAYEIDWDYLELFYKKNTDKIQYVYLQCTTNKAALKLYEDRVKLMKKWENYEIYIHYLMQSLEDIIETIKKSNYSLETCGLLVVPISSIFHNKAIPKKSERKKEFSYLIEKLLGIDKSQVISFYLLCSTI